MRIIIINFFYPPTVDAHAYRWAQIAQHWVRLGHEVEVITSRVDGQSVSSNSDGVLITRVGLISRKARKGAGAAAAGALPGAKAKLLSRLRALYHGTYWPDAGWYWAPSAIVAVLKRLRRPPDLVVSYYPFMGAHLAASIFSMKARRRHFAWVADYGDPFSPSHSMQPNNFSLYNRANLMLERFLAKRADALVFTNELSVETYQKILPRYAAKIRHVPHLADVAQLQPQTPRLPLGESAPRPSRVTCLTYIGGFHTGIREPYKLFDLMRVLNKNNPGTYLLHIYGPENGFDLSPADCPEVVYLGMVPRQRAFELMRDADILVNVENENCIMSPSKIVEYIATGRPVISLGGSGMPHEALQRYMDSGQAIAVRGGPAVDRELIDVREFLSQKSGSVMSYAVVSSILEKYTLDSVASQYLGLAFEKFAMEKNSLSTCGAVPQ